MSDNWVKSERTITTVEYTVPALEPYGANWNQVQQALDAAIRDLSVAKYGENIPLRIPADNEIQVHVVDDAIVISYEKPKTNNGLQEH